MAKKTFIHILRTGLMSAAIALAIPACTDDHFDVNDGGGVGANATKTLWEQLEANPELSKFKDIVAKTPYFKDEAHPVKGYTYKDVLNGTQILTVFAPTNAAISDTEYQRLLNMAETNPYDVYLTFVGNHIARFRYIASGTGEEDLVMINGKRADFDREAATFKGISLIADQSNVGAINGTLHAIGQESPFAYNIYEYIRANGDRFGEMRKWLTEHDTIYFNASQSAEGGSDADGNPIYVDSVYTSINTLMYSGYRDANAKWMMAHKGFSADLENEDSIWAMVIPTDAAWNAAAEKMRPWYKYAPKYVDKSKETVGGSLNEPLECEPDSMRELAIRMDLASPLVFNVRQQPRTKENTGFWTQESFVKTPMGKMFNTRIDTFKVDKKGVADVKALLFDGPATYETVSNGLVYPVNHWNFMDAYGKKDVEVKVTHRNVFKSEELGSTKLNYYSFNSSTSKLANDSIAPRGSVSENYFYQISAGASAPTVNFRLIDYDRGQQVLSGIDYEIGFVMVPDFYRINPDSVAGDTLKNKLRAKITFNDGTLKRNGEDNGTTGNYDFDYEGTKVDTIWLNTDSVPMIWTPPYTYKNLTDTYPTINVTSRARAADLRQGYQHPFCIDRIILRAKEE